jgi:hypothetical protein
VTLADAAVAAVILAGALGLLFRSLWTRRGACHGCSSGGACRSAPREPSGLVSLGAAPPAGRPGDRP